ncbi:MULTISPECIES: hypothetical protein [Mycobacterium]|uniref:Uncharacterized protein n=2 Tax=Mycobacterium TaxID=1763 RepID=A0AA37Q570_9MYCO|nr:MULTISPECIES: hypothetical protein [Mycobacterium]APA78447.2 hypothetical protein KV38_24705 [Mycobacterium avium subsp. hominissuis]GLB86812.1 hypothetical protein SRL2020028_60680 [Mycobacterium kiyosense]
MTDPTNVIDTFERAQVLALGMLRLAPDPAPVNRQDMSVPLLATLLYAASPGELDAGLGWVQETVSAMAAGEMFAPPVNIPDCVARKAVRIQSLNTRQKLSIYAAVQGAIAPWVSTTAGAQCA